jgi:hypothetical protein
MHKRIGLILRNIFLAVPVTAFFCPNIASAATTTGTTPASSAGGLIAGISDTCSKTGTCQLSDFFVVGANITKLILGISGSVMLIMVVYGGFLWLVSSGNSSRVEQGKKVLSSSLLGLIIVFGAYTLIWVLLEALGASDIAKTFSAPFGGK